MNFTTKNMYAPRGEEYARAYIKIQDYENLLSLDDAFKTGTIFMDLYFPYDKKMKEKC